MTASDNARYDGDGSVRSASTADASYPDVKLQRIAFGSCHSRKALNKRLSKTKTVVATPTIWDTIEETVQPQAFFWTGDAIYPPAKTKGDTPLAAMRNEYDQMIHNKTLGYAQFIPLVAGGVHGTWDDHDYGGNDRGRELKEREERRDAYLEFLDVPKNSDRWERKGVYGSIEFGEDNPVSQAKNNKVKVIFLDTRWHRERHCIPSVGANPYIPYGALVACATRWITAGLDLASILPNWCSCSHDSELLGEAQWMWLEQQLEGSKASIHVVISSIQVLTTNPVVESWGHFPRERDRLLKLLNYVPGLVILSGDVHHAELSTTKQTTDHDMQTKMVSNKGAIVEITSSGLTHSCDGPFYGPLCKPILDAFPTHRFQRANVYDGNNAPSYFTGRNFGSINIDWSARSFDVNVHSDVGGVVLTTSVEMDTVAGMSHEDISSVAKCIDGHLWLSLRDLVSFYMAGLLIFCIYYFFQYSWGSTSQQKTNANKSKIA